MKDCSKRFVVTVEFASVGENVASYLSGLPLKNYFYILHPSNGWENKHYHIFLNLVEKVDKFVINDYFGRNCLVFIPRVNEKMIAHCLSHCGKYEIK